MRQVKYCGVCKSHRIGLLSTVCDECTAKRDGVAKAATASPPPPPTPKPEKPKTRINGPCRYCGEMTRAESIKTLFCSASCHEYNERRKSARNQRMNAGQVGYMPTTDHEKREHNRALKKRYGAA